MIGCKSPAGNEPIVDVPEVPYIPEPTDSTSDNNEVGGEFLIVEGDVSVVLDSKAQVRSFEYTESSKQNTYPKGIGCVIEYKNGMLVDTIKLAQVKPSGFPSFPTSYERIWYSIVAYDDRVEVTVAENTSKESRGIFFDMSSLRYFCRVTLTQSGAQ